MTSTQQPHKPYRLIYRLCRLVDRTETCVEILKKVCGDDRRVIIFITVVITVLVTGPCWYQVPVGPTYNRSIEPAANPVYSVPISYQVVALVYLIPGTKNQDCMKGLYFVRNPCVLQIRELKRYDIMIPEVPGYWYLVLVLHDIISTRTVYDF